MSRDFSKPYTPQELDELLEKFRTLPSYNKAGGWISASDIPEMVKTMGFPRTPEQVVAYQTYWEKNFSGRLRVEDIILHASHLHETSKFARDYVLKVDADNDGFIDADEFEELVQLMRTHDPKVKEISFEDFVLGADTNKDGKVSIDECVDWFEKHYSQAE